jgi:tetratricopeptide (TPR) repeat protein
VAAETTAREEKARAAVEEERAREAWRRVVAERRARRRALALAAAVFVLLAGGGAGLWWQHQNQEHTDQAVERALDKAEWLETQAQQAPLEMVSYQEALQVAGGVAELASGASRKQRQRYNEVVKRLEAKEKRTRRDQRLLTALLEAYGPQESPLYSRDEKGGVMALGQPTVEEQLASAFREWGLDVDAEPTAAAVAKLKELPREVRTEAIAGLDEWAQERRLNKRPQAEWRRLADLAATLDESPGSKRRELRAILESGRLPIERALGVLGAALRPVPVPVETPLGQARGRIRQMAAEVNGTEEPILGLLLLTRALRAAGEEAMAEQILRDAIQARPREVVLYHALTQVLKEQEPPRWAEAVEFYQAARALRPDLGVDLAVALLQNDREREADALVARLLQKQPDNPYLHYLRGYAYYSKGKLDQAEEAFSRAIERKPDYVDAYLSLGVVLNDQLKYVAAEKIVTQVLALKPKEAQVHFIRGIALSGQGKYAEAEAAFHEAIKYRPEDADTHYHLGIALSSQNRHEQAEKAYRKAIQLRADFVDAHIALGVALNDQKKHPEAEEACRQALKLRPDEAEAYTNLGLALLGQAKLAEAEAACRQALELQPDHAEGHCNLGDVLRERGRLTEALAAYRRGHELGCKLPGWRYPSLERIREVEQRIERERNMGAQDTSRTIPPAKPSR